MNSSGLSQLGKKRKGRDWQRRLTNDRCKAAPAYLKSLPPGEGGCDRPDISAPSSFLRSEPPAVASWWSLAVSPCRCRAHQVRLMRNFDGAVCHFDIDASCLETSWTHSPHRPPAPTPALSLSVAEPTDGHFELSPGLWCAGGNKLLSERISKELRCYRKVIGTIFKGHL